MPIDYSNVNISLDKFQQESIGTYNAGDVRLSGKDSITKVNNHVIFTGINKTDISREEVMAVKNAFVRALQENGVTDEAKLSQIRQRLGLGEEGKESANPLKEAKPLSRQEIRQILDENAETINKFGTTKIVTSDELYKNVSAEDRKTREATRNSVNQSNDIRLKNLYLSTNLDRARRLCQGDFKGLSVEERSDMRRFIQGLIDTLDAPEKDLEGKVHFSADLDGNATLWVPDPDGGYKSSSFKTGKPMGDLRKFLEDSHEALIGYKDKMSPADARKVSQEIINGLVKGDFSQAPRSFMNKVNDELKQFAWQTGFDPITLKDLHNFADRKQLEAALTASIAENGRLNPAMFVLELRGARVPEAVSRAKTFASELKELLSGHPIETINHKRLTADQIRKLLELSPDIKEKLENCHSSKDVQELVNGSGRIKTWYSLQSVANRAVLTAKLDEVFTKDGLRKLVLNDLTRVASLTARELAAVKKDFKMPAQLSDEAIAKKKEELLEDIRYGRFKDVKELQKAIKKFAMEPFDDLKKKCDEIYYDLKEPVKHHFYMMAFYSDDPSKVNTRLIQRAAENEAVADAYIPIQMKRIEVATGQYSAQDYANDLRKLGEAIADTLEKELQSSNTPVDRNSGEFRKLVAFTFLQKVGDGGMLFRLSELKNQINDVAHGQYDYANILINTANEYHVRFNNRNN